MPKGNLIPICFIGDGFPEFFSRNTYVSGFGRRSIPHCLTDLNGPEAFEVCGRPLTCSHDHRLLTFIDLIEHFVK